jgi:protein-tyrosine phosphatase
VKCDCILTNLYIGPDPREPEEYEQLRSLNVTAILNLQTEADVHSGGIKRARQMAKRAGFGFISVPVMDFDRLELQRKLPDCVRKLDRLLRVGHTVYIHCTAGVNRSPTVAVAYLHWCLQWPLDQASTYLHRIRDCCPDLESIRRAKINAVASSSGPMPNQ